MREKQEKQLQDYIRVNLRKVMLEQKENEAKEAEREKTLEEHAREARLESLRKYTRRKLGGDVMAPETGIKSYVKGLFVVSEFLNQLYSFYQNLQEKVNV